MGSLFFCFYISFLSHRVRSTDDDLTYDVVWYDQVNERFRLSGVGHFDPYCGYYGIQNGAAKEYEEALVGHVRTLQHKTETLTTGPCSFMQFSWWHYTTQLSENTQAEFISAHWSSLPLAMHMSCWKLAQWVMGPALLDHDKNLELSAGVILKLILHQSHLWYDSEKRVHYDLSGDPYRIPQVKQLIARSKEEKKEKEKRQRHSEEKPKARPRSSQLSRLPIEVFEMTLDYLTVKEILKLEDALLLVLVDGYWRRRASWDLVEINELSGEEETIDWRYLCTHLDRMIRRDEAFDNRNHVTRILRDHVKPEFLRILEEGDHPSLEQIIVE